MAISFVGQAVVITGAGGGLGSTYAKEIARRGGMVVVNDLGGPTSGGDGEALASYADAVVEDIRAAGGQAIANYDTVATAEGGQAIVDAALSAFGRIDAVIANAGTMRYGEFEKLSLADLHSLLSVHIGGTWSVAQAAWPHFRAQRYGRLVCTASSTGMFGAAGLAAYAAAKGGVMGLMHALANAGAQHGILANAVMPNAMTRMTSSMNPEDVGGRPNPWAGAMPQFFDPGYTTGLATYLASSACQSTHGLYSACMGRIGRAFIGVTDGVIDDERPTVDQIAERWARINDAAPGFAVPEEVSEEWRHVAELRGLKV